MPPMTRPNASGCINYQVEKTNVGNIATPHFWIILVTRKSQVVICLPQRLQLLPLLDDPFQTIHIPDQCVVPFSCLAWSSCQTGPHSNDPLEAGSHLLLLDLHFLHDGDTHQIAMRVKTCISWYLILNISTALAPIAGQASFE